MRAGAIPPTPGRGWIGEVYLDFPSFDPAHAARFAECRTGPGAGTPETCGPTDLDRDADVDLRDLARFQREYRAPNLIWAERFLPGLAPAFTFRTDWIDFPAGPVDSAADADFSTIGDFLDGYIYEVSNPDELAQPFGAFVIQFRGYLAIRLADEVRELDFTGVPIWIDVGMLAYDAYSASVGIEVYREINVARPQGQFFTNFGPSAEVLGLFPITITYYNIYDPDRVFGNQRAGVEVYSWHGGGLPWPGGENMVHPTRGPATLIPPWVIYQAEDIRPVVKGDFEADADVDLRDFQWFLFCADPTLTFPPYWCEPFDVDNSRRVDPDEFEPFRSRMLGPGVPAPAYEPP